MQQQHGAIAESARASRHEGQQEDQLKHAKADEHHWAKTAQRIEMREYIRGVAGADELAQCPHQHRQEYGQTQAKQGQTQAFSAFMDGLDTGGLRDRWALCNGHQGWILLARCPRQGAGVIGRMIAACMAASTQRVVDNHIEACRYPRQRSFWPNR